MKKLVDFQLNYNNESRIISSEQEFEALKSEFPNVDFGSLDSYVNYRKPSVRKPREYVFNQSLCKTAIEIERETKKAYRLQISHISRNINGVPDSRHFKWVAKSVVTIIDGVIYYPKWA